MKKAPVLFLIFNRPDLTNKVFSSIREYKPEELFIASDGPRDHVVTDSESCELSKKIVEKIDWDCKVKTLFRDNNLGCKKAVESAITWFFEHVPEGIILEDDCLPHPTFYYFCSELLRVHRNNEKIALISGFNPIYGGQSSNEYIYSMYAGIWGWATWRRVWSNYDNTFSGLDCFLKSNLFLDILENDVEKSYWANIFRTAADGGVNSWAYPWLFSWWRDNRIGIVPKANLIQNIGFGSTATHTKTENIHFSNALGEVLFPLTNDCQVYKSSFDRKYATLMYLDKSINPPPEKKTSIFRKIIHLLENIR